MDLAEVSGYVKSIKQEDGKVSATAVANIPASDVTVTAVPTLHALKWLMFTFVPTVA